MRDVALFKILNRTSLLLGLVGLAALIAVGLVGLGKAPLSWMGDFYWYHAAGRCFFEGSHMYDVACVRREIASLVPYVAIAPIAYPPHFAPVALLSGALPAWWAASVFTVVNCCAAISLVLLTIRIERREASEAVKDRSLGYGVLAALILGSSGLWGLIWLGQVTLILTLCLWLGFLAIEKGRDVPAGIFLAIAAIKPQLALFVFFWLLLNARARVLAVALATALIMALYPLVTIGFVEAIRLWLSGLATYQTDPANTLGSISIGGIPSLLAVIGINFPIWAATALGAAIVVAMRFTLRSPPFSALTLATLLSLQMLVHSRPIDMVMLAPAFALFWPNALWKTSSILWFLAAAFLFAVPQQLVTAAFPFEASGHFRTALLIAIFILFARQALKGGRRIDVGTASTDGSGAQVVVGSVSPRTPSKSALN